MKKSVGLRARLGVVPCVAVMLSACLGGGDNSNPEPVQPEPPQIANTPPTANAGADQVVAPGATVNLTGAASSDANGSIAAYAWTQTSGSAVTLASASTATPSFAAPAVAGALAFQLTVTDNGGASHTDTVTVTVNAIPVANAGADQTVSAGAAVSLSGSGSDADGSVASYSWAQTSGAAVTLSNANTATLAFTAPAAAANLGFSLTVTDNHGGTHVDSVSVTVTAIINPLPPTAPTIARHPENTEALEYGSVLLFVAAAGQQLNYEWRTSGGAVIKSGPEPYVQIDTVRLSDDGDCYYVFISNISGTATSNQACLEVEENLGELNLDDNSEPGDPEYAYADDEGYAQAYGDSLLAIAEAVSGRFTGRPDMITGADIFWDWPRECDEGEFLGTTVDGVPLTETNIPPSQSEWFPLGQHTVTISADTCRLFSEYEEPPDSRFMLEYDFPETIGIGTYTVHFSGPYIHGSVHVEITAGSNGHPEEARIEIAPDFSMGDLKTQSTELILVTRRYMNDQWIDDAYVNIGHASLHAYGAEGHLGRMYTRQGGFLHSHQDPPNGLDDGVSPFTTTGIVEVGMSGDQFLAALEAYEDLSLRVLPRDNCPDGYSCYDPPSP